MADRAAHLVERAAAGLRGQAGFAAAPSAAPALAVDAVPSRMAAADPPPKDRRPASGPPTWAPAPDPALLDMAALKRGGFALGDAAGRVAEEFRVTGGRILRELRRATRAGAGGAGVLLVTSARPGEGKSFFALNLAASLARTGPSEVLLVDADAGPRSLSARLGLHGRPGLLDLADRPEPHGDDVSAGTAIERLRVLARGTGAAGAAPALPAAIAGLRRQFADRVVILDAGACLSSADPGRLAPLADAAIMLVQAGRTGRAALGAALERVGACPNVVLVLNQATPPRQSFAPRDPFGLPS